MSPNDIADELYKELGCLDNLSIASMSYWFKNNVGLLNNRIQTTFVLPDTETDDFLDADSNTMNQNQKSIYKGIYQLKYYQRMIDYYTSAAGVQSFLELSSDGGKVRMIDKNTLSQTYLKLRAEKFKELELEILDYMKNLNVPYQIDGDDTVEGTYKSDDYVRD